MRPYRIYAFMARFHANVQASHDTTLEITCEEVLTPRGDCIILTSSTHDPNALREVCKKGDLGALCVITRYGSFCVRGICTGLGECSLVIRKSNKIDSRTFMILSSMSASDIDRGIIRKNRVWGTEALVIVTSRRINHG